MRASCGSSCRSRIRIYGADNPDRLRGGYLDGCILDEYATLDPREMWEAPIAAVAARLAEPGSKARNERGALSVHDFKKLSGARIVWPLSISAST